MNPVYEEKELEPGSHDNDTISEDIQVLKKLDKRAQVKRTAMGEYIPGKNGKPLTQLALPNPGPADYSPNLSTTKPANPRYSIVGKARELADKERPGPNQYTTSNNMIWKKKTITLKGKENLNGKESAYPQLSSATYQVTYGNLGTSAPRYTFGGRPKESFWLSTGPPNKLVQPVDTVGFKTPGPAEHRPSSAYWGKGPRKSIGLAFDINRERYIPPALGSRFGEAGQQGDSGHESPAEYDSRSEKSSGPSYSFGKRLEKQAGTDTPGPGAYDIGTTIGNAMAKSITGRQKSLKEASLPSPNTYTLPSYVEEGPQHSMTYRAFEPAIDTTPGPAEYFPTYGNLAKSADYSCRRRSRPVFPDILHYKEHDLMKNEIVGPGAYKTKKNMAENDGPSYSMGRRFLSKVEESPGPATYKLSKAYRPNAQRAPEFSMGERVQITAEETSPGAAAYNPESKRSGPRYSMSSRGKNLNMSSTPAPNSYQCQSGQTHKGTSTGSSVTLKGRPSPYVYSGFRSMLEA